MKTTISLVAVLLLTSTLVSGCFGHFPQIDAQHPGSIETKESIANGIQHPVIDANGYVLTPWMLNSMMSAFAMRAAHIGLHMDPNGVPVIIHITGAKGRSDEEVMTLGYLKGWDKVSATVDVGDARFDIYSNSFTGLAQPTIQEVSRSVGRQLADGIAKIGGLPMDDE
jgi:hypothetical protein